VPLLPDDEYLSDRDARPSVGWPDRLLMALIREHPERIPEGLLDYLNRGRVHRSSLDPDERSAGPSR